MKEGYRESKKVENHCTRDCLLRKFWFSGKIFSLQSLFLASFYLFQGQMSYLEIFLQTNGVEKVTRIEHFYYGTENYENYLDFKGNKTA